MLDTKQKILDAAERLFSEQGYGSTSLRHIIAEAGVNLAAIHYHFGSKEDLLDQVVARRAGLVNRERLMLLAQFEEQSAPAPVPLEKALQAFLMPALLEVKKSPHFVRLMGRMHAEGIMPRIVEKHFRPTALRFFSALHQALPALPKEDLHWRTHFVLGAMALTLSRPPHGLKGAAKEPPAAVAQRLITFLSAGLRAPATQVQLIEVK